ncbi:MAG: hypothetical protein A3C30_02040 [Candidatus Levybacteria bacterium RIFCSPHIGHO2_02_FULL_40_18]|nr:MAG: hypothetical protein A2869_04420 [Candidatus Levybacteria bacterium RIFCSPHIGHO2_01_FULL_40_58]OGH26770.1 MAG: hypothetical protein A3C30_02040 [Candidatus Levybacteria bacterium RIFCSPHIGHO2_02_FULL_40_18]OGH31705.1 MAG: hypothetical protein A3E43_01760 [Candidatus Levybacteria bacterium RIFCSPHIGHO2_12_FULL_40_31]OGH40605.1 MAG: hypothetical protein A2894_00310 [Candidatus Levybacteria bacterium RIFCSPLOWO2_01_FULL_40_64]OGH48778.1 MAG: hypothetical protein A3I54_03935 [Candidatus Lev
MELAFLIPVLTVCFFLLYILCRQDFVLLRQNISLSQILDMAIITIIFAFVAGRLLFLLNNLEATLLHAIRFFYFIKFPGVSPLGFFLGGAFSLWFLMRGKKGILRISDIFSISFLPLYLLSLLLKSYPGATSFIFQIAAVFLSLALFAFVIRSHYKYILRDGSISLILLFVISIDTLLYDYLNPEKYIILFDLSINQLLSIILVSSSVIFLVLNQRKLKI